MTKLKMLAATAILTSVVATPVLAQDATQKPAKSEEQTQATNTKAMQPTNTSERDGQRMDRVSRSRADRDDRRGEDRMDRRNDLGRQSFNQGFDHRDFDNQGFDNRRFDNRRFDDRRGFDSNARYDVNGRVAVNEYTDFDRRDRDFRRDNVVGGIVGGAVGTAGAIATAPFRGSYASYDGNDGFRTPGYNAGYNYDGKYGYTYGNYDARNAFLCQPGSLIRGEDGRPHICQ